EQAEPRTSGHKSMLWGVPRGAEEIKRDADRARYVAATACISRGPPLFFQQWLQIRPELLRDATLALRGRMDAVGLVQPWVAADAFEQKRRQRHARGARHPRIDGRERPRVLVAVVRRQTHAREQHARPGAAGALDDAREVASQRLRRLAPQPV